MKTTFAILLSLLRTFFRTFFVSQTHLHELYNLTILHDMSLTTSSTLFAYSILSSLSEVNCTVCERRATVFIPLHKITGELKGLEHQRDRNNCTPTHQHKK